MKLNYKHAFIILTLGFLLSAPAVSAFNTGGAVVAQDIGSDFFFELIENGAEVVAAMTEKDSDNDGVNDSSDDCPTTAAGINVDNKGCELPQSFVLKGVNFVTGSSQLTEESKQALNDVAETLKFPKILPTLQLISSFIKTECDRLAP